MNADEQSFWDAIAATPGDMLNIAIFADYLQERGDVRGDCLRWCVETRRNPIGPKVDDFPFNWWLRGVENYSVDGRVIPKKLYWETKLYDHGIANYYVAYLTWHEAFQDLCEAWKTLIDKGTNPLDAA
jgi:uncharacterized protein (TIGR02996 family)